MRIRRGKDRHPIRHGAAVAFCLFLLTSLNACLTTQADEPRDDFDRVSATQMFDAGFSYINDIYIEQPDLGALVMTGLNGLRRLEPGLAVVRSEDDKNRVMVMFEGRVAGSAVAGSAVPLDGLLLAVIGLSAFMVGRVLAGLTWIRKLIWA